MCGIYATYLSENSLKDGLKAQNVVFEGIKRVEYRGYDSWGVAVLNKGMSDSSSEIVIEKHVGKISTVKSVDLPDSRVAIGHTRWATHGGVTQTNAHPHLASDGSFVLVQNGVVENYQELRKGLMVRGYDFKTETDTEVIVALLEIAKKEAKSSQITNKIIQKVVRQLKGRSTVVVMTIDGDLYAFRSGSPLVVGKNDQGSIFFSSDVLSMAVDANQFFLVDSEQLVTWVGGELKLYDIASLKELPVKFKTVDLETVQLDKAGFDHFMLKEIYEQAQVFSNVTNMELNQVKNFVKDLKKSDYVFVVGAGSASYVAKFIAFELRSRGIMSLLVESYESESYKDLVTKNSIAIFISQSGETADTNEVVEWMKNKGVKIASIVNMPGSTLTQLSDYPFMLQVGPEVAIASTKAMVGQMVWGKVIALMVSGTSLEEIKEEIRRYERQLKSWFESEELTGKIKIVAEEMKDKGHMFVLGRGQLYPSALEFALKMKEISYIHAEGFSGGELKHGVIALIEEATPVVCLIAEDEKKTDMLSAAAEVKARGAYVIGVATQDNQLFDNWIEVPENDLFIAMSTIITSQLMTYYLALKLSLDPDKPRNLAKSVTVK